MCDKIRAKAGGKKKVNGSHMRPILGEYALANHWEDAGAARSQSPIYIIQEQHVSLLIVMETKYPGICLP